MILFRALSRFRALFDGDGPRALNRGTTVLRTGLNSKSIASDLSINTLSIWPKPFNNCLQNVYGLTSAAHIYEQLAAFQIIDYLALKTNFR